MAAFSAVVVAAGQSRRFFASAAAATASSKNLVHSDGKPLIRHTVLALLQIPLVEVVVVTRDEERPLFEKALEGLSASIKFCQGGSRRQDSVRLGLKALRPVDFVMVHDGARPYISRDLLQQLARAAERSGAVIPGVPIVKTVKEVSPEGQVIKTLRRERIIRVQTPQVFSYEKLCEVHSLWAESSGEFTDDAQMFERANLPVQVVPGESANVKVTFASDLRQESVHHVGLG